jgi:hypothetical protein
MNNPARIWNYSRIPIKSGRPRVEGRKSEIPNREGVSLISEAEHIVQHPNPSTKIATIDTIDYLIEKVGFSLLHDYGREIILKAGHEQKLPEQAQRFRKVLAIIGFGE